MKPMTARVRYFLIYTEEGTGKEHPVFFSGDIEDMERVFGFNYGCLIVCDLLAGEVIKMLEKAVNDDKISIGISGDEGRRIFSSKEEKEKVAKCCREIIRENSHK